MTAHENTRDLCRQLAAKSHDYNTLVRARGPAEVAYKVARAKRILTAKADGAKSQAEAETIAIADSSVADLWLAYLDADATADACGKAMLALRTRIDYGRSEIATARAVDALHAQGRDGAA